jgi:hypothetical protein
VYCCVAALIFGVHFMVVGHTMTFGVSTCVWCVLAFVAAYFLVMFGQTVVFLLYDVRGSDHAILRDTFVAAGISLSMSPLLSTLFIAIQMHALEMSGHKGSPQGWAQDCMLICVFATCIQSVCCLLMPIFIGSASKVDEDGNPDYDLRPMIGAYAVSLVKYVALLSIHGCVIAICIAIVRMTPEDAAKNVRKVDQPDALSKVVVDYIWGILIVFFVAMLLSSAKVVGIAVKLAIESVDQLVIGVDVTIQNAALSLL